MDLQLKRLIAALLSEWADKRIECFQQLTVCWAQITMVATQTPRDASS